MNSPFFDSSIISTCPSLWKQIFNTLQPAISTTLHFNKDEEPCFNDGEAATCAVPVCLFRHHMPHKSESNRLIMSLKPHPFDLGAGFKFVYNYRHYHNFLKPWNGSDTLCPWQWCWMNWLVPFRFIPIGISGSWGGIAENANSKCTTT